MRLFLLTLMISFNAMATNWPELAVGNNYKLRQHFQLPQSERSGTLLDFSRGDEVTLKIVVPITISYGTMILHVFDYKKCPGQDMSTEQEIVTIEGSGVDVVANLENCELNVFVESNDYNSQSLFE